MRALLGLLVLGGLCLLAATWQQGHSRARARAREQRHGLVDPAERDPEWSLLVLGRASGAPPIPGAEPPSPRAEEEPAWTAPGEEEPDGAPPSRYAPDYRYVVQRGDVLSVICQHHYGTARQPLVQAVARYNALEDVDGIRAGATLLLPDRALLGQ